MGDTMNSDMADVVDERTDAAVYLAMQHVLPKTTLVMSHNRHFVCPSTFKDIVARLPSEMCADICLRAFTFHDEDLKMNLKLLEHGKLEIFTTFVRNHDLVISSAQWQAAARGGCIDALEWLDQRLALASLSKDKRKHICSAAAAGGSLAAVQWCLAHGCEPVQNIFWHAAAHGHIHIVEWARKNDVPKSIGAIGVAARNGHLEMVKWLRFFHDPDIPHYCAMTGPDILACAADGGQLHVVKYLYEADPYFYKLTWDAMWRAACSGKSVVVEWLLSKGCPPNPRVMFSSLVHTDRVMPHYNIRSGNLEMVKLFPRLGFPLDRWMLHVAMKFGQLHIIQWLVENDPSLRKLEQHDLIYALSFSNMDVLKYLQQKMAEQQKTDDNACEGWFIVNGSERVVVEAEKK